MAVTISQTEAIPAAYPDAPSGLSIEAAAALDAAVIWQRLESYVAHRWTVRGVVWTVEGEGEWTPPLTPATIETVEVWESYAWTTTTLNPSPLGGFELPGDGPYRFTGTVGDASPNDVPAAVLEAFRRLAEYSAEVDPMPGTARYEIKLGELSETIDRSPTWMARAMQNSGAGDLLRAYRRA